MPKKTRSSAKGVPPPHPAPPTEREEDFFSGYANNIRFESTVYDLKLVFGETDLSTGTEVTKQFASVTIPWALVKVGLYFLKINLEMHEIVNGKVSVPPSQIPPPANPVPPELINDPNAQKAKEIIEKYRQEFVENL